MQNLAERRAQNESLPPADITGIAAFGVGRPRRVDIAGPVVLPTVQG